MYAIKNDIQALLSRVEESMNTVSSCEFDRATECTRYTLEAGGKRTRSEMIILLGLEMGVADDTLVSMAAAVELMHAGTLMHDDVIDGSSMRRGRPAAWKKFTRGDAILGGDLLFMAAIEVLGQTDDAQLVTTFSKAMKQIGTAEVLQNDLRWNPNPERQQVEYVAQHKTGPFFGWICASIARLTSADANRAYKWGLMLGAGFQLADDMLDFAPSASVTGKSRFSDLRQGLVTMPVLHIAQESVELQNRIEMAFASEGANQSAINAAYDYLGGDASQSRAHTLLDAKRNQLNMGLQGWAPNSRAAKLMIEQCLYRNR